MSHRMFRLAVVLVAATGLLIAWQIAGAQEKEIKTSELPKVVVDAVKKAFPKAEIVKAGTEAAEMVVYEASLNENGQKRELAVTEKGDILEIETVVAEKDLPKPVAKALAKAAEGGKVQVIEKIEYVAEIKVVKLKKPEIAYEAKIQKDGKTLEVKWDAKGKLLVKEEDAEAEGEEN